MYRHAESRASYILPRLGFILLALIITVVFVFRPVSAAVGFRAASSGNNAGGATTLSIAMPTGTVQNDVMIAVVSVRGGTGTTITPPTDWVQINSNDSTTVLKSAVFRKTAGSGESGPYVWTFSTSAKASGVISSYSGVDTTAPINANGSQANASNATMTAPSITTTVANTMIIAAFSTAVGTTVTAGSSMTERGEDASTGAGAATRTTSQLQDITQAGTGATGAKTATAGAAAVNIGHTIALTPVAPAVVSQVGYRFFENSTTAGSVGLPRAAQDTMTAAPPAGEPIRLRVLLGISSGTLGIGESYRLEYKTITTGTCNATGTFAAVTTATPIRWYDNTGVADAYTPLSSSVADPVRSGISVVSQSYEEDNTFAVSTAISPGSDAMWDLALTAGPGLDAANTYCLRVVTSAGTTLSAYSSVPAIKAVVSADLLASENYRLYQNADSLTPGSPLAGIDTSAIIGTSGGSFRLRMGVNTVANQQSAGWKQISAGGQHTCAIGLDDLAYCWGSDEHGQLGNGATTGNQPLPVAVDTSGVLSGKTILSISAGLDHTCAIASDNLAYCWGYDGDFDIYHWGQLGNGATTGDQPSPVAVDTSGVLSGLTIKAISAGDRHTCAIASNDKPYCWGTDDWGQIGNGNPYSDRVSPAAVSFGSLTALSISAGYTHTCAVASDNQVYCWGGNWNGELGDGNGAFDVEETSPVAVDTSGVLSGKTILSVSAGTDHTCAIASDNLAYCWGSDDSGALGNGATTGDQLSPVAVDTSGVLSGKTILSVSAGSDHTCAIASDNLAYCWGGAALGGASPPQVSPVAVSTSGVLSGKTITSISAGQIGSGFTHACVTASDSQAYCWGSDSYGHLGNNASYTSSSVPVTVYVDSSGAATIDANSISFSLQFAQKTAGSCSAQTGYTNVTGSTVIAFYDNATPVNGATITSNANDPIPTADSTAQTYHEAVGVMTNPTAIDVGKVGLWDFSLYDNGAPGSTTYCLRLAGADGTAFGAYDAYPEFTTAAGGGPPAPTLDQMTRGGSGVINGVKQNYSW